MFIIFAVSAQREVNKQMYAKIFFFRFTTDVYSGNMWGISEQTFTQ